MIPPAVAAMAEDAAATGPEPSPASGYRRTLTGRYCLLRSTTFTSVSRLRLPAEEVEQTVAGIRAATAGQQFATSWWVGGSAQPSDLVERLLALGLRRATDPSWEPVGTAMALVEPPPPAPGIVARRVESYEEFVQAAEIALVAFEVPEAERGRERAVLRQRWQASQTAADAAISYLAWIDDEPVAMARAVFLDPGVALLSGAVLPEARGRGAYRALVGARWADAVARGTPALTVVAGSQSRPILERLGFETVTQIQILLDDPR